MNTLKKTAILIAALTLGTSAAAAPASNSFNSSQAGPGFDRYPMTQDGRDPAFQMRTRPQLQFEAGRLSAAVASDLDSRLENALQQRIESAANRQEMAVITD